MYPYDPYDPYSLSPHSEQNYFIQDIDNRYNPYGERLMGTRNLLKGRVVKVTEGAVNSIVVVDLGCGNLLTTVVTMESLKDLGLREGSNVTAIINPNDPILML
ncbi:MAG TPA: TOBE domain-containing protein [Bacillota bacterium]|nr:TOBE domain-containing protein [Bacillota bacterium]